MKLLHISDIHWRGSQRHEEYVRAFKELIRLAREEKPTFIVCTGDIFHTKTQNITPEVIEKMVWMFNELANVAPIRVILGNHDGNLANANRQDVISPLIKAIDRDPDIILFKDSGTFLNDIKHGIAWNVFSCFDKDGWSRVYKEENLINITMFHGSIIGCQTDGGYRMMGGEESVNTFLGYDFALFGDIHKQQFLSTRATGAGEDKPWMAYPGSLIQQNFGEEEKKGFLVWDIQDKTNWDVRFVELTNFQPYVTFPWKGSAEETLSELKKERNGLFLPGARYRMISSENLSDIDKKQIEEFLKTQHGAEELVYKIDISNNLDNITVDAVKIKKTSLRNNPDILVQLYNEFLLNNPATQPLTDQQQKAAVDIINNYLVKLNTAEPDVISRDVSWSIKSMDFDNIFRYGEGNTLDFTKLKGIVGILGNNRLGKSSLVGTMMYSLFNATDRGPMKTAHVINKNKTSCRVRTHLEINGTDYVVERTSQKDEPKRKRKKEVDEEKTSTSVTITQVNKDGSTLSCNAISRDDTDKELRKLIGTSEDFLMTSFASQGNMNKFIDEGATERKAILSRFLDLDIFKKLCDYAKEDCGTLNAKTKRYSDVQWEQLIEDTKKEIQQLEASKLVLEKHITATRVEVEDLRLWIFQKEKEVDMASILQLEADLENKERLLVNAETQFSSLGAAIKVKHTELLQVDIALQDTKIEDLEKKQETLEDLKTKIAALETSYLVENNTLEHQEKSVRKLDLVPCGDMFPRCHFIRDSHENKSKLDSQKTMVEELKKQYEETKVLVDQFLTDKIADKIKEFRTQTEKKLRLENSINELRTKQKAIDVVRLMKEKNELKESLEKIRSSIDEAQEQEIETKKTIFEEKKNSLKDLESQKNDILVNLGSCRQKLAQSMGEKDECLGILEQLQVFESVYRAFNKNGIPAMVLKSQLPAINAELEKILMNVIDFKISLETDTSSNVMDLYIEDSSSKRIIETASGMEKMISSLALRVALINLSSLPKSDIFVLDEGFGSLDETSIHQCMQLMILLKTYFRVIFVITHIGPIKEIADRIVDIKDDGTWSYVNV